MTNSAKKWALGLALSLGLNLFLLGAATVHWLGRKAHTAELGAAARLGRDPGGPPGGRVGDEGPALLREMVQVLGGPRDPRVQALWGARRHEFKRFRTDMDAARAEVRAALVQEPFDRAVLEKAFGRLHAVHSAAQRQSEEAVLTLAGSLEPAERKKLGQSKLGPPR